MNIADYIIKLKNKFNYDENLCNILEKIIPAIIEYYGKENEELILDTLYNCEIHIQKENEEEQEYIDQYFDSNDKIENPSLSGAYYEKRFKKKDGKVISKSIIFIKTKPFGVFYVPFDEKNLDNIAEIIHEICHAIKSQRSFYIHENNIIDFSGMRSVLYESISDDSFKEISANNIGIDEAFNTYDHEEIMKKIYGNDYNYSDMYESLCNIVKIFMQHENIKKAIIEANIYGSEEWKKIIGEEKANLLIRGLNVMVNILYKPVGEQIKPNSLKQFEILRKQMIQLAKDINIQLCREEEQQKKL